MGTEKPHLMITADCVAPTGFARVSHNLAKHLEDRWRISFLGLNAMGDPHPEWPWDIYPASAGGHDPWGIERWRTLVDQLQPDIILAIQDYWIISQYLERVREERIVAYMPIDGGIANTFPKQMTKLDLAILYTQYGLSQLRHAGYEGPACVIPHGIDLSRYEPMPQREARASTAAWLNAQEPTPFVVGTVARNQPRKRLDLTIQYFSTWWHRLGSPTHVYLWLHCAVRDVGWDLSQLADYWGVTEQLIFSNTSMTAMTGVTEAQMQAIYNSFDVQLSTSDGEGWGLCQAEACACGIPNIVPEYAALAEWAKGGVSYVPATLFNGRPGRCNMIGAVPSEADVCAALDRLYQSPALRAQIGAQGRALVEDPQYRWGRIADQFDECFRMVLDGRLEAAVSHAHQEAQGNGAGAARPAHLAQLEPI